MIYAIALLQIKFIIMKSSVLIISTFVFLCLSACTKKSEKNFKPSETSTPVARTDSTPEALPYYLRYQIYREDFQLMYGNYLKNGKNEGC